MPIVPVLLQKIADPLIRHILEKFDGQAGRFDLNLNAAQIEQLQRTFPINADITTLKKLLLLELVAMRVIQVSQADSFKQQMDAIVLEHVSINVFSVDEQYLQFIQQAGMSDELCTFFSDPAIAHALKAISQQFPAAWPTALEIYQVGIQKNAELVNVFPQKWRAGLQQAFENFDKEILTQMAIEYGAQYQYVLLNRTQAAKQLTEYPEKLLQAALQKQGFRHFLPDKDQQSYGLDAAKHMLIHRIISDEWHAADCNIHVTDSEDGAWLEVNITNIKLFSPQLNVEITVPGIVRAHFVTTPDGWQLQYLATSTSLLKKRLQGVVVDFAEVANDIPHEAEKRAWLTERSMPFDAAETLSDLAENAVLYPDTKGFFKKYQQQHAEYLTAYDLEDIEGDATRAQHALILAHCDLMLDFNAWLTLQPDDENRQRKTFMLTNVDCPQVIQAFQADFEPQAKQILQALGDQVADTRALDKFRRDYDRSVGVNNNWVFFQGKEQIDTSTLFAEELFSQLKYTAAIKRCILLFMKQENFNWLFTETLGQVFCSQIENSLRFHLSDRQAHITFLTDTQFEIACRFETFLISAKTEAVMAGEKYWCPLRKDLAPVSANVKLQIDCTDYANPKIDVTLQLATTFVMRGMERLLAYPKALGETIDQHPERQAILHVIGAYLEPPNAARIAEIIKQYEIETNTTSPILHTLRLHEKRDAALVEKAQALVSDGLDVVQSLQPTDSIKLTLATHAKTAAEASRHCVVNSLRVLKEHLTTNQVVKQQITGLDEDAKQFLKKTLTEEEEIQQMLVKQTVRYEGYIAELDKVVLQCDGVIEQAAPRLLAKQKYKAALYKRPHEVIVIEPKIKPIMEMVKCARDSLRAASLTINPGVVNANVQELKQDYRYVQATQIDGSDQVLIMSVETTETTSGQQAFISTIYEIPPMPKVLDTLLYWFKGMNTPFAMGLENWVDKQFALAMQSNLPTIFIDCADVKILEAVLCIAHVKNFIRQYNGEPEILINYSERWNLNVTDIVDEAQQKAKKLLNRYASAIQGLSTVENIANELEQREKMQLARHSNNRIAH